MLTLAFSVLLCISLVSAQANGFCTLTWADEFNDATLNTNVWTKEITCSGGGNNELQCYTPRDKNIYLQDGKLVLAAFKETYTGTQTGCTDSSGCTNTKGFTSGRINSANSPIANFLHGRMEIKAKLTSGSHLWPAIWMLPTDYSYGGWAASGEIDIMEQRGDHPNIVSGTLHHGAEWPNNVYTTTGDKTFNDDLSQDYHTYAVEWTTDSMKWFVDSTNTQTYDLNRWWNSSGQHPYTAMGQPWDKRFHFVFNVAVGGGFFGGYPALTDDQVAAWKTSNMMIDYVRVWNQGGDCTTAQSQISQMSQTSQATSQQTSQPTSRPTSPPTSQAASQNTSPSNGPIDDQTDGVSDDGENVESNQMDSLAKTTIIIAAAVGGGVFILGVVALAGVMLYLRSARRRLDVAPAINTPIHNGW